MSRLLLLVLLGGCAQSVSTTPETSSDPTCDAGKAQSYIGASASSEIAEAARKAAGAELVRWLRPGMAVTMEYRMGRLNITIDDKNVITGINCG